MVWKMGPRSSRSIKLDRQRRSQEPHEVAYRRQKRKGRRRVGLAAASLATRKRVARMGGRASHR